MKKCLTLLMAASMLFGTSGAVFAEENIASTDGGSIVSPMLFMDGPYDLSTSNYVEVAWEVNN
ncbi:hypothetical protein D3C76_199100 [compost metagenome]